MENLTNFHPKIMGKTRTAGDGMESEENSTELISKTEVKSKVRTLSKDSSLPTRLVQVYAIRNDKQENKKSHVQIKSPKFVPFEPYPGAVKPIVPQKTIKDSKKSRNNMDINTLISQMSKMDTNLSEFKPRAKLLSSSEKPKEFVKQNPEIKVLQLKVENLIKENDTLKEQLQQQAQVNKELKTMLVASMGEDLETQVQCLNEDKKHLANALINSSKHLSTHQEQTEWLAGQCEVWRSKFLASSLMVEELAYWKKILSDRTESLQQAIKLLLDERCRARDMMMCTYKNLYSLHERWLEDITISNYSGNGRPYSRPIGNINMNTTMPRSTNILDLALVNLKISENISCSIEKQDTSFLKSLSSITDGEVNAENIMALPLELKKGNEEPVNALVHHAYNNCNTSKPLASCVHCSGKVQLL